MVLGLMMKERILTSPSQKGHSKGSISNFLDHLGPTQPSLPMPLAAILLVLVVLGVIRGICKARLSPAFCAGGVGIISPVADQLLSGFGDMVCGSCDELEHIPSSYAARRAF